MIQELYFYTLLIQKITIIFCFLFVAFSSYFFGLNSSTLEFKFTQKILKSVNKIWKKGFENAIVLPADEHGYFFINEKDKFLMVKDEKEALEIVQRQKRIQNGPLWLVNKND